MLSAELSDDRTEAMVVAGFDARGRLRLVATCGQDEARRVALTSGTLRAVVAERTVRAIVIAHTHPRGPAEPSAADLNATRRVAAGLETLGLSLQDALICAPGATFSFQAEGLL